MFQWRGGLARPCCGVHAYDGTELHLYQLRRIGSTAGVGYNIRTSGHTEVGEDRLPWASLRLAEWLGNVHFRLHNNRIPVSSNRPSSQEDHTKLSSLIRA